MKHCSILGCSFPGWVRFYPDYDVPVDEDAPLKTWKETCFFCNGTKYSIDGRRCICDENGQVGMFDYTCETKKVEYRECFIHFGVFNFIYYDLVCRLINRAKRIITR